MRPRPLPFLKDTFDFIVPDSTFEAVSDATRIAYELDRFRRQRDANNFTPERTKRAYPSWREHTPGPLRT
jgi:hypothetical protein